MADYQSLIDRGTNVANQPYQQYPGELVAPLSGQTTAGLGSINQSAGYARPFMNAAAGATMAAATPIQPTAFSTGQVGQYMNPYTQDVINATQGQFNNQNQQAAQFLNSQNISSGAFGGDRAGVSQAILANQQQTAQAPVIAGLYNQNYNQALSEFNTQQGVGLQAQAFNNQQLGQMGKQLGDIGTAGQQAGLQGAMAQIQGGMIPQQEQQQIDTALYNQYLQQQAYPFQSTGWLGSLVEGVGSLSGGMGQGTSTTTAQQGSPISQGLGAGLSGLGMLGNFLTPGAARGGRITGQDTENHKPIGKTFDGHTIYRFNYKGDPRHQVGINRPHFALGGAPTQQNLDTLPPVGQQAMVMGALGDQGAKAGMGNLGLMATSPTTALATARPGFQSGGFPGASADPPIDPLGDLNSPLVNGQVNPLAGIANSLYDTVTAGSKSPQFGFDESVPAAIGTGSPNLATPMTQIPGPAQNYPAIDWQNPGNDFQTAGAEASLQGLIARPGVETSPSESNPAASALTSAAGQGIGGGGGLGGVSGSPGLSNNLNAWASGNPAAFGSNATAQPGTMPGVSVGQRMAPISAAPGGQSTLTGGAPSGAGVIQAAHPPRASVTPPPAPAAAPAAAPSNAPRTLQDMYGGVSAMNPSGNGALFWDNWGGFTGPSGVMANDAALRGNTGNTNVLMRPAASGGRIYRAAGGMLGQSGMAAALQQPPQQAMVTGQNSANQPGFSNMFGGSSGLRPTFAGGGGADPIGSNPYQDVVSWVPTVANPVMGHGPSPPPQISSGGGGGGGGGQPSPGMPDSKELGGLKKLFNKATGPGAGPASPAAPLVTPVPPGQGGIGGDAVAGGTAGDQVMGPAFIPDLSQLGSDAFDMGGADLGGYSDVGLARGGFIGRRGHFALGGMDNNLTVGDDPPPPMQNDPEAGSPSMDTPLPPPRPKDQGPPPAAVDRAKTASMVGSAAPPGHFKVQDPNQDPLTSHTYPAPTEKSGPPVPIAARLPSVAAAPGAAQPNDIAGVPRYGTGPSDTGDPSGRLIPPIGGAPSMGYPALAPGPANAATPPLNNVGKRLVPPGAPSGALARARQGQPAFQPAQAVPQAPAVGALGAVKPMGANLQAPPPLPAGVGGPIFPDLPANRGATTPQQRADFITRYVQQNYPGKDPRVALGIANAEGLGVGGAGPSSVDVDPQTGQPFSFGDFQMNIHPGALGDKARQAGFDPADPNQWQQVGKFAIDQMYGGKGYNVEPWKGDAYAADMLRTGQPGEPGAIRVAQAGASDYDPNAVLAHINNGQPYFTAKDYADPNSSKRPLFQAMMYAGMAMMGGESRNPWINIGRGGMAGMDYYQKQTNYAHDWIEKQAQIDHLSHEDRRLDVQTGLEAQKMQLEMMMYRLKMDEAKGMQAIDQDNDYGFGSSGASGPAAAPQSPQPKPAVNAGIAAPGADTSPVVVAGQQGQPAPSGALPYTGSPPGAPNQPPGGARGVSGQEAPAPAQTAASAPAMPPAQGTPGGQRMDWNDAPPEMRPQTWLRRAQVARQAMDFDNAQKYATKATELANANEYYSMSQGRMVPMPGHAEVQARTAGMEATSTTQAKAQNEPIDAFVQDDAGQWTKERFTDPKEIAQLHTGVVNGRKVQLNEPPELAGQTAGEQEYGRQRAQVGENIVRGRANIARAEEGAKISAKQTGDEDEAASNNAQALNVQNQRLEALKDIMLRWRPGAATENLAQIANVAKTFGIPVKDPSDTYEFMKNATGEVFDSLKEQKGQVRNMEITGLSKANPSTEVPSEANAAIIAQMQGVIHQRQDYTQAYLDWRNSPAGKAPDANAALFAASWKKDHDVSQYVDQAKKNIAYQGQKLGKTDGQLYMMPDGRTARYNAAKKGYSVENRPK